MSGDLLREVEMEGILVLIVGAILLDLAALRWAVDSTEGLDSAEWQRREAWNVR
jgi:hypothetical protein